MTNVGDVSIYLNPGAQTGQLVFHLIEDPLMEDIGRKSPFSGSGRPQLAPYKKSKTEQFLLEFSIAGKQTAAITRQDDVCRMSYMNLTPS